MITTHAPEYAEVTEKQALEKWRNGQPVATLDFAWMETANDIAVEHINRKYGDNSADLYVDIGGEG